MPSHRRSTDAYGTTKFLDDSYDYDPNGNVAAITDGATGRNQRGNRDMTYDGLDRLTAVASPGCLPSACLCADGQPVRIRA